MSVWANAIQACVNAHVPKVKGPADDTGFDLAQRWGILDAHLPVPGSLRLDPQALLEVAQFNLGLDVAESDAFIGIGRKGKSFLDEARHDLHVDATRIHSDSDIETLELSAKRVLIVDDAIHTGKTMVDRVQRLRARGASVTKASVILTSDDGLAHIVSSGLAVAIRQVLRVPESRYTGTYQRSLVPAMEHYRGGSLSNRPCRVIEAKAASYQQPVAAEEVLRVLAGWPMAGSLAQTPCLDGSTSPIFRGTLELSSEAEDQVRAWSGGLGHEQVKVRIFIDARDHLAIHASGVYYPEIPNPATPERKKQVESSVCTPLLASLAEHLRAGLLALGYSVNLP